MDATTSNTDTSQLLQDAGISISSRGELRVYDHNIDREVAFDPRTVLALAAELQERREHIAAAEERGHLVEALRWVQNHIDLPEHELPTLQWDWSEVDYSLDRSTGYRGRVLVVHLNAEVLQQVADQTGAALEDKPRWPRLADREHQRRKVVMPQPGLMLVHDYDMQRPAADAEPAVA